MYQKVLELYKEVDIISQNKNNNFSLEKINEHSTKIVFDYIDFNDGIILNIFHTGFKTSGFIIEGTFIGANKITYGIRDSPIISKLDFVSKPVNYLINQQNLFLRITGYLLTLPTMFIMLPLYIILIPFDTFLNRLHNNFPKKFLLDGYNFSISDYTGE